MVRKKSSLIPKNKRWVYIGAGCLLLIIGALFALIIIRSSAETTTGASVYVEYYGLSNPPMKTQAGKLQTYIQLTQPALGQMEETAGLVQVAGDVLKITNFTRGIVELYQRNPPAIIHSQALESVGRAAAKENDYFLKRLTCWKRIWDLYGHQWSLKAILVSELKYQRCANEPEWLSAYMKHSFWNKEEGFGFICDQEDDKLFLVKEKSGEVRTNVTGC